MPPRERKGAESLLCISAPSWGGQCFLCGFSALVSGDKQFCPLSNPARCSASTLSRKHFCFGNAGWSPAQPGKEDRSIITFLFLLSQQPFDKLLAVTMGLVHTKKKLVSCAVFLWQFLVCSLKTIKHHWHEKIHAWSYKIIQSVPLLVLSYIPHM